MNKKGVNVIKEKLLDRGIQLNLEENLKVYIDEESYHKNIIYLIEKYKKLSKNKSIKQMKLYIKNKLLENGYNIEEFCDYIDVEDVDELSPIKKEIAKFFKNKELNKENISKITKKLLSKGFNYDIIKQALGSDEYETY
jgi:SOS response regulatory protein OraA/RecX